MTLNVLQISDFKLVLLEEHYSECATHLLINYCKPYIAYILNKSKCLNKVGNLEPFRNYILSRQFITNSFNRFSFWFLTHWNSIPARKYVLIKGLKYVEANKWAYHPFCSQEEPQKHAVSRYLDMHWPPVHGHWIGQQNHTGKLPWNSDHFLQHLNPNPEKKNSQLMYVEIKEKQSKVQPKTYPS